MLRRQLAFLVAGLTGLGLSLPFGVMFDIFHRGPYVSWYNERCLEVSEEEELVGKPESAVTKLLGEPTSIYRGWTERGPDGYPTPEAEWCITYNYAPYDFLPLATFQVHVVDEMVKSVETYND